MNNHDRKSQREPQYNRGINTVRKRGVERLGLVTSWAWHDDPRHLVFTLARYKFVAKMFEGYGRVLEVGCGDGFPTRIVSQAVRSLVAVDFDQEQIENAKGQPLDRWPIEFRVHDIMQEPVLEEFEGIYALDVLEHIVPQEEDRFLTNLKQSLVEDGVLIIGSPSIESQQLASQQSREGHVNCKNGSDLRETLRRHFANVFVFSMNDEMVHTGHHKMAHYLMALCCKPTPRSAR
jgi:2-polyprenyl-3-methyl-5-hydroxy-6-metoxy-1,4-benzoquinol methylase